MVIDDDDAELVPSILIGSSAAWWWNEEHLRAQQGNFRSDLNGQDNKKQNRDILEFILAEFEVYMTLPSILLTSQLSGADVDKELDEIRKILKIVPVSEDVIKKTVEIDSALVREDTPMKLEELIIVTSSIVTGTLLAVNDDVNKYKSLGKYGLE